MQPFEPGQERRTGSESESWSIFPDEHSEIERDQEGQNRQNGQNLKYGVTHGMISISSEGLAWRGSKANFEPAPESIPMRPIFTISLS